MPRSRFPFPAAKHWRRKRSTDGSASSAACRSSAPPASSCPIRARHGSIRSIPASMWRAPPGSPISPARPARVPRRRAKALRPAGDRADRHGRFRRRHAEISAPPSGAARHHRRRRRQDDQAGAGPDRSAFQARRGRSRRAGELAAAAGGSAELVPRIRRRRTPPPKLLRWRKPKASRSATRSRARHSRPPRTSSPAATSPSRSCCSTASKIWSAARRSRIRTFYSRGASPEAAAIIRVIERAVAKIFARRARGRRG